MTSPDHNEPGAMETYLEAIQHNRVSDGFDVELSPTFGYVSNIESAERVRRHYQQTVGIKFSTYRQSKDYGKQDIETDHHKVCWEDSSRLRQGHLVFDYVPYIVIGIKMLDCQYGKDRHIARKKRSLSQFVSEDHHGKRKQVTGKKVDCPAQIALRDILKFPNYAVDINTVWRRKVMSEKLRKSLSMGSEVKGERRIYIKFPEASDHNGHQINFDVAEDSVLHRPDSERIALRIMGDLHGATDGSGSRSEIHSDKDQHQEPQETPINIEFAEQDLGHQAHLALSRQSPETSRQKIDSLPSSQTRGDTHQRIQYGRQMIDSPQSNQTSNDINQAIQCRRQMIDSPQSNQTSGDTNQAIQCRRLLDQLTEETFSIQDSSILDALHQQLEGALRNVQRAKQKRVGIPSRQSCTDTMTPRPQRREPSDRCTSCTDTMTPKPQMREPSDRCTSCTDTMTPKPQTGEPLDRFTSCTDTMTPKPQTGEPSDRSEGNKEPVKILPDTTKRSCSCKERSCRVCSTAKRAEITEVICDELGSNQTVSSRIIREAQALILDMFPLLHGFEEVTLGQHLLFSAAQGEFGQLMHDGKDHWVFVTSISCDPGMVKYYDSMGAGTIPDIIRKQIACIVCSQDTQISVEIQPVQLSKNTTDCGLFALAFAASVLHSEDPGLVCYDITSMRRHLYQCFKKHCLKPFPKTSQTVERTAKRMVSVDVFCLCRMPWNAITHESKMKMAQCSMCGEWWHSNCCGIPDSTQRPTWKCPRCEDVHSAVSALNSLQSVVFPNENTSHS
ncbi:uncharacterized protein LOC115925466 isoform X1 [Strongylocentrotus purpuratus]|uniref:PHD-type domain-containing protein n=1 Tax=Strongylocentrotus purpuratus TaxID=7668 RepID=A0A7M7T0Q1_STRPU|nr:uncharacterized protein LOC115925466 isoform X1 [Strongylocentrotus purpuratus]